MANEDDTDTKLAILSSLFPLADESYIFETLINADGDVETAQRRLQPPSPSPEPAPKRSKGVAGQQLSIRKFQLNGDQAPIRRLTTTGKTLHLYDADDIEHHTPCSIIHNFLPADDANQLLLELLEEAKTFRNQSFKLFDRVVQSPHTSSFYVETREEQRVQTKEYVYNGSYLDDVREIKPHMKKASAKVEVAVNEEIQRRIRNFYPDGKKLRFQSPGRWKPNAAFVNCYASASESVGAHADQLTYLGPRAVIGSLSLGVAREFRVRKVVPKDEEGRPEGASSPQRKRKVLGKADEEGQIAIHLPHNSLLIMHAEMQEEWKHAIAPALNVVPHHLSGTKRLNITYRHYRSDFHPDLTPKCKCKVPTVLRCVQRKQATHGRYMWMVCTLRKKQDFTDRSLVPYVVYTWNGRLWLL